MSGGRRIVTPGSVGAVKDFKVARRTSGNLTLNSATPTWANVDTGLDLVLNAAAGDELEIDLSALLDSEGILVRFAPATIVGGSVVNRLGGAFGISGWVAPLSMISVVGGSVRYTVQAADVSYGTVTLRLQYQTHAAGNKTLYANTDYPLEFSAKNIGQPQGAPIQIVGTMAGYYPDLPPLAPHANDDEFTDGVLGAAWTEWDAGSKITVTEDGQGLKLTHSGQAGVNNYGGVFRPAPVGDFAVVTKMSLNGPMGTGPGAGMFLAADLVAAPGTAAFHVNGQFFVGSGAASESAVHLFTNYATFSATAMQSRTGVTWAYQRIRRIGTTVYFDVSFDGSSWANLYSVVPSYTPASIGLFVNCSLAQTAVARFRFWRQIADTAVDAPLLGQNNPTYTHLGSAVMASPNGSLWQVSVRDSGQMFASIISGQTDYARGITPTSDVSYTTIANATDGNDATTAASTSANQSQYVQVDLGTARLVKRMHIIYADDGHRSVNGSLQYSTDGTNWSTAVSWASDTAVERWFTVNQTARYWRHQSTAAGNGSWGIDIKTWELLG